MHCGVRKHQHSTMSKTVQKVKNSLKFKADEKNGLLTVRFGVKKFVLPHNVRMICDGKYMFLSFTSSAELYKVEGKNIVAMDKGADATEAYTALNPAKPKKGGAKRGRKSAPELPSALAEALRGIPSGYRLGVGADGTPKLVKTRVRRKKS
jgi:hypothetical protein